MSQPTSESTTELVRELQLVAKQNSPQRRAKLDLPLLTALGQRNTPSMSVGQIIDAAVTEAAAQPESAPLQTLFPPSAELWDSNLSGRQRRAAAQVGMSYDSFRRRRGGRPSPYDDLCEALVAQLLGSFPQDASTEAAVRRDLVTSAGVTAGANGAADASNTTVVHASAATSVTQASDHAEPVVIIDDKERPRVFRDTRIWLAVGVGALLVIAAFGVRQMRSDTPDPVVAEPPVTVANVDLGRPTGFTARPAAAVITLSWMPAADGAAPDGYDISRDDVGYWTLDDPTIVTFTDDSVEPGRTYAYAVTPWMANGSDDPADRTYGPSTDTVEAALVLMLNSLGQPIDFAAVSTAAGIRLEWQSSSEGAVPDGFDIARDGAGYWSLDDPSIRSFVDESAELGQTYTYAVTPWLANGSDDPADRTYGPASANVAASSQG